MNEQNKIILDKVEKVLDNKLDGFIFVYINNKETSELSLYHNDMERAKLIGILDIQKLKIMNSI